jgi:hypothetical protein
MIMQTPKMGRPKNLTCPYLLLAPKVVREYLVHFNYYIAVCRIRGAKLSILIFRYGFVTVIIVWFCYCHNFYELDPLMKLIC